MPLPSAAARALQAADLSVAVDAPLARRTWWRVGGPADALVTAHSVDEVVAVQRVVAEHDLPLFVLGNGSNLLVSDAGVRGVVLVLAGELRHSAPDEGVLDVGGGLKNAVLLARSKKHRWVGPQVLAGIPGTVGGAVRMNAGAALGEVGDHLVHADLVLRGGERVRSDHGDLGLGYRTCALPEGAVVVGARLRLGPPDAYDDLDARMRAHLDRRKATQPLSQPSCGSTFRNPPGDHAGRLIEASGLKGHRIGGAQVSPKHANFLVNTGGATARDLARLIAHVRAVVEAEHGVRLVREVQYAGDWPDDLRG